MLNRRKSLSGILGLAALWFLVGACTTTPPPKVTGRISKHFTPERMVYCFDHGCRAQRTLAFSKAEWAQVRGAFAQPASDAADEREQLGEAIGYMERVAGAKAGTWTDIGGTIPDPYNLSTPQLDCYDEATNTSNFMGLLERDGLLRFHRLAPPALRTFIAGDLLHATAVLEERASGTRFAIDSWFHDNGMEPSVVPLDTWIGGWRPADYTPPFTFPWSRL